MCGIEIAIFIFLLHVYYIVVMVTIVLHMV